jgi:flagellar hook-length control protein FliK
LKAAVRDSGTAATSDSVSADSGDANGALSGATTTTTATSGSVAQSTGAVIAAALANNSATTAAAAAAAVQSANSGVTAADDADDADVVTGLSAVGAAEVSSAADTPAPTLAVSPPAASLLNAQTESTLLGTGDTDKHSHDDADTSTLGAGSGDAAAGLAQSSSNPVSGSTAATPVPTLRVSAGVESPDFAQGLANRVSWMVDNGLNGARLQVNPPQLGPIELRISVQGDHAQVWMSTHSEVTRDALESSSPKLREMLGAQGFGQVSVDISQRSFQDRSAYSQPYERTPSGNLGAVTATAVSSTGNSTPRTSLGAVDAYA